MFQRRAVRVLGGFAALEVGLDFGEVSVKWGGHEESIDRMGARVKQTAVRPTTTGLTPSEPAPFHFSSRSIPVGLFTHHCEASS